MRGGLSLIEILVVCALVGLVVVSVLTLLGTGRRGEQVTQLTVAMHGALFVADRITVDLKQIGLAPGPDAPVRTGRASMAFYRAHFDGPRIRLRPVRYSTQRTPSGNLHLVREEWSGGALVTRSVMREVALRSIAFADLLHPAGHGRYVTVALTALSEDLPPAQVDDRFGGRTFSMKFLQECMIPALFGEPVLAASANLTVEGALPPVE